MSLGTKEKRGPIADLHVTSNNPRDNCAGRSISPKTSNKKWPYLHYAMAVQFANWTNFSQNNFYIRTRSPRKVVPMVWPPLCKGLIVLSFTALLFFYLMIVTSIATFQQPTAYKRWWLESKGRGSRVAGRGSRVAVNWPCWDSESSTQWLSCANISAQIILPTLKYY